MTRYTTPHLTPLTLLITLTSSLMNILPSSTKFRPSPKLAVTILDSFVVSVLTLIPPQLAPLQQQQQQPFYGPLSRTTQVGRYQKKHLPTHHPDHHPIFNSFFHIASSLFKLRAWQSFFTTLSMSSCVISTSVIHCKLDYCNSLYYNLPKSEITRLQRIQNSPVHVVVKAPKCCHITPILCALHWLKVTKCIESKLLSHTYKSSHPCILHISA